MVTQQNAGGRATRATAERTQFQHIDPDVRYCVVTCSPDFAPTKPDHFPPCSDQKKFAGFMSTYLVLSRGYQSVYAGLGYEG
ncbi:hypothetical protein VTH06DRAFT_55 [Thermothelomyces fergusii]